MNKFAQYLELSLPNSTAGCSIFSFYQLGLTAKISIHNPGKMWDGITHLFRNFNCCTVEVCEWVSNFIKHITIDGITRPYSGRRKCDSPYCVTDMLFFSTNCKNPFYLYGTQNLVISKQLKVRWHQYRQISNTRHTKSQNLNVSRLALQLSLRNHLQPEWRYSWSSTTNRRCSNYIWVIKNVIAY